MGGHHETTNTLDFLDIYHFLAVDLWACGIDWPAAVGCVGGSADHCRNRPLLHNYRLDHWNSDDPHWRDDDPLCSVPTEKTKISVSSSTNF